MAGTGSTAYIVYIVERNTELENIKQGAPYILEKCPCHSATVERDLHCEPRANEVVSQDYCRYQRHPHQDVSSALACAPLY